MDVRSAILLDLTIVILGSLLAIIVLGRLGMLVAIVLASWRLEVHGETWRSIGLCRTAGLGKTLINVAGLYFVVLAGVLAIVYPLGEALGVPPVDRSSFANLQGDSARFAARLISTWTFAAFCEELLFRGFLLTRFEKLFGTGTAATARAVIAQAVLFGAVHASFGLRGIANATVVGLVFGAWYAFRNRNLWPLIVAHGLINTIFLALNYAGI